MGVISLCYNGCVPVDLKGFVPKAPVDPYRFYLSIASHKMGEEWFH